MTYKIIHKNSTVSGTPPAAGDIDVGELAINAADAELYTKDINGVVRTLSANTFTQAGTGAVQRTVESKLQDVVSVKDFGAVGDGSTNDAAVIQSAIDSLNTGGTLVFPPGSYRCNAGLTVAANNTQLVFESGARLSYATATQIALTFSGSNCKLINAVIDAPAVFDGTNAAITYGNVKVTGEFFSAQDCILNNVPRCGFWFSDVNNGAVRHCTINGGTSEGFYTGTNTVHFGIAIDPNSTGSQGNFIIADNFINRCVQGAGSGNTGSASLEQSMTVSGNVFELCWNHGWYSSGLANGITVTANAFNACQIPIALTGENHAVIGNTLTVGTTGSGLATDNEVTGISLRDPVNCVVSNNSIKGEGTSGGVVIGLDDLSGVPGGNKVHGNIVSNNTIEITNTTIAGVVAIRLLSESTTTTSDNIISGNTIKAPVRSSNGLITITGGSSGYSGNNSICDNIIVATGLRGTIGYGILCNLVQDSDVTNNKIRIEFDAASSSVFFSILLSQSQRVVSQSNQIRCTAAYGANTTIRGFCESTSGANNRFVNNTYSVDTTKATVFEFNVLTTSSVYIDHVGSGTPEGSIIAAVGSLWRRTNGGTSTTFYVKESGTSNTGWIAK
jgi:hypothetical protein